MSTSTDTLYCSICGREIEDGWGNNPDPIRFMDDEDARCCDLCNMFIVIPARLDYKETVVKRLTAFGLDVTVTPR